MTKTELDKLIHILSRRCHLTVTTDPATNVMTYDEWLTDILNEMEWIRTEYPKPYPD
jgi:hypothetical protein